MIGLVFANILTGAVLVEKIFSWPGIGQYAYNAAINLDVPGDRRGEHLRRVVYVTINFIVDVLYGDHRPEDPRHMSEIAVRAVAAAPRADDRAGVAAAARRSPAR